MALAHVVRPVTVNPISRCPTFPMRDGGNDVLVFVMPIVLDKLGCETDYVDGCNRHRHELERIARDKYGRRAAKSVVITLADVMPASRSIGRQ